jgi:hypothetical protein
MALFYIRIYNPGMRNEARPVYDDYCHNTARKLSADFLQNTLPQTTPEEAARALTHFLDVQHFRHEIVMHQYDLTDNLRGLNFREARENLVELADLKKRRRALKREIKNRIQASPEYGLFATGLQNLIKRIGNMKMRSPEIQCIRQNVIYGLRDALLEQQETDN